MLTDVDLADSAEALARLLGAARERHCDTVERLAELPEFGVAQTALVAVGGAVTVRALAAAGRTGMSTGSVTTCGTWSWNSSGIPARCW
jgi:hypothetical protein